MMAIKDIWRLRVKLSIHEEENGVFVFPIQGQEEKIRVLERGPWFFNNNMLLLANYNGVSNLAHVPLHFMELWVDVKGFKVTMWNEKVLT